MINLNDKFFPDQESEDEYKDSYKKAYNYLIRILTKRDYSRFKLEEKLRERKYDQDLIKSVIEDLIEKRFLREENYTEARIKGLIYKGLAPRFIIQKLNQERIAITEDDVLEILSEQHTDTNSQLDNLIDKKWRKLTIDQMLDFNFKQKLIRFLLTKGHDYKSIESRIQHYIGSKNEDEINN